jgi:Tol biopolymer transport system component
MIAVYPSYIDNNQEMYTYTLWDLAKSQLIVSLDKVFTTFTAYNKFPFPHWSPDGSGFVFQGSVMVSDELVTFELYRVNRDGETEQLTHLNPVFSFQESNLSWSPDGKYIAMYLNKYYGSATESHSQVAVLNMDTLDILDFCNLVNNPNTGYSGELPFSPIWSPDGRQFLVMDWYAKDHSRVILIDIDKGTATQIAEDMQPVGWLVGEKSVQ